MKRESFMCVSPLGLNVHLKGVFFFVMIISFLMISLNNVSIYCDNVVAIVIHYLQDRSANVICSIASSRFDTETHLEFYCAC